MDITTIRKKNLVFIPSDLVAENYHGAVFGNYIEDSGVFNILAWNEKSRANFKNLPLQYLGEIRTDKQGGENGFVGHLIDGEYTFYNNNEVLDYEEYSLMKNIFSRNTGILETDWMLDKCAIIIGCGSVGSLVALELAKAGVGRFFLVDNDIVEYHNICRHQCGILEVGEYKINALEKRIQLINPNAAVGKFIGIAENIPKGQFEEYADTEAVIIGCADNREADVYMNALAVKYQLPFVSIGFWERAYAGELFYFLPEKEMPCYDCALFFDDALSERQSVSRRYYTDEVDLSKVNFEPGIAIDIDFITLVGIKLIVDILNRNNEKFTSRVINELKQFTLVCNTNNPKIGGEMAEIFAYPLQITRSLEVGFSDLKCPPCKHIK
jgi:molybdopterin/thiamine biosynthesis adenylyltransferase